MKSVLVDTTQDQKIHVSEDSQYVVKVDNYSDDKPSTVELVFDQPGVSAEIIMVYSVPAKGKLNVTTIAHHVVPNTSCLTKVRGVLHDHAVSNYVGKILIGRAAQQTSSFLDDAVLVVGNKTKNESQPILMIEADDVRASHGATTGRINTEEIYYLQTRGFAKSEAENIIEEGFLYSLLDDIADEDVRESVAKSLESVK
jgi:Fe-S cluster assembly scaffold protein SufB